MTSHSAEKVDNKLLYKAVIRTDKRAKVHPKRPGKIVSTSAMLPSPTGLKQVSLQLHTLLDSKQPPAIKKNFFLPYESQNSPTKLCRTRSEKMASILSASQVDMEKLRNLAWTGIPDSYRNDVWLLLLGVLPVQRERHKIALQAKLKEYQQILDQINEDSSIRSSEDIKSLKQIQLDIPRTNSKVKALTHPRCKDALFNILNAYSIRHPATGYVQGMNDLALPFLYVFVRHEIKDDMNFDDVALISDQEWVFIEAKCFCCLSRVLDGIQDHYTKDQPGIQKKVYALQNLIGKIDPRLNDHFETQIIDYNVFAYKWMNCFFMREFSLEMVVRLWDTYFCEESAGQGRFSSFHVNVCAALLNSLSEELKSMDMEEIVWKLQDLHETQFSTEYVEELLAQAFVFQNLYSS